MIGVSFGSSLDSCRLLSVESPRAGESWGVATRCDEGTNCAPVSPAFVLPLSLPSTERTICFAVARYADLLRRLADQASPEVPVYLTTDEIVALHDRAIDLFGGMRGVRDPGALDSCAAQPRTVVFGHERYPTLFDGAAAYCFFIVRLHPFFDGNKRTGFLAALHFLLTNGQTPVLDPRRMYQAITRVATSEANDIEELARLFREGCEPQQDVETGTQRLCRKPWWARPPGRWG